MAPTGPPLRRYIVVHAGFAIAALIASIVFQLFIVKTSWFLVLDGILVLFLVALVWIWEGMSEVDVQTTLVRLCVASCGLAAALVLLEQWFIHLTPLIVILPLMMATGELDVPRYRVLVRWAIAVIVVTTITARVFPRTPIYPLTTSVHRTIVALTFTPAFVVFIGAVAWRNHAALSATMERLEEARQKLRLTETNVQNELRAKVAPVQSVTRRAAESLADIAAGWLERPGASDGLRSQVMPIRNNVRDAVKELRTISSELGDDAAELLASAPGEAEAEALESPLIDVADNDVEPTLVVAIQTTIAFSIACFSAAALMYVFVDGFRTTLMLSMLGVVALAQIAPALAARFLVENQPRDAVYLVAFALWVPPIIVGYYFALVKAFFVPAMLIPIVISLPHLNRTRVAALSAIASVAVAVMIAVARLTEEAVETSSSPDAANDAIVIVLLPLGTFIVLWLANRNHLALLARNRRLRRSQREVERSYQRVRKRLRQDLHDGSQQRLISALLRLSIAERSVGADGDAVSHNMSMASDELAHASSILATLKFGPNRAMTPEQFEAELDLLAGSSAAPVTIEAHDLPDQLPARVVDVLWYGCAEAVANTLKHAGPDARIAIALTGTSSGGVCLTIDDDGRGFDPAEQVEGTGLSNIRERFGGTLDIRSSVTSGTTLHGCIALEDATTDAAAVIDLRDPAPTTIGADRSSRGDGTDRPSR